MTTRNVKRWKDLSLPQQAATLLLGMVQIALLVAALLDIRRRPPEQINGTKRMWTLLVFINYVGPIAYFLLGRKRAEVVSSD
jgi:hypothetical protein